MLVGQALVVLLVLAAAVGALGVIEAISGSHRVEALLSLVELMLGCCAGLVAALGLVPFAACRIVIAEGRVDYRCLLRRRRRFPVSAIAAMTTVNIPFRGTVDSQLVLTDPERRVLLRLRLSLWPDGLAERFREAGATSTASLGARATAAAAATRPLWWTYVLMLPMVAAVCIGVSLNLLISDLVTLPSAYADLSHQGVPVTARLVSCTEGGDDSCALSFTYADATTTWTYPQDTVQFDGVPIGSAVPLLVDRSDPSLRYTTYDVDSRFNAGFGIATVGGLVIMATGGVTVLLWVAVMRRMGRRRPGHAPGSHATGPRERG